MFQQIIDFVENLIALVRNYIYNQLVILNYTEFMNKVFLESIEDKASILDIGIGTGLSMTINHALIKEKGLNIDGIDIDPAYCTACDENIKASNLEENMTISKVNIYDYNPMKKYDYVLFSDSYAVIPNVHHMIDHCKRYLKPNGQIVILTTLEDEPTPVKIILKPRLIYFTLCEFGKVTTKLEFMHRIQTENSLKVKECNLIYYRNIPLYGEIKSYMTKLLVTTPQE
jgi:2-polyprenyl-3-methyl-5-hydroxy-6-metoxy-1,4-benzoquinol methylase